ncbi:hypothetical protein TNCV_1174161 [Trichonephila clavipes]|nr:hypothetical protein TNCV_1174161 [Trichonephila clavipes]
MVAQRSVMSARITIRRDGQVLNTKHLILTFSTPDLPQTVKMAYIHAQFDRTSQIRCAAFSANDLATLNVCRASQPALVVQIVGHDSADCKSKGTMFQL